MGREKALKALEPLGTLGSGLTGGACWPRQPARTAVLCSKRPVPACWLACLHRPGSQVAHRPDTGARLLPGDGIYIFARLPDDCSDDKAVCKWLVHRHKVSVIPGSGCGERIMSGLQPAFLLVLPPDWPRLACGALARQVRQGL